MKHNFVFHFFVNDLNIMKSVHGVINHFWENAKVVVHESLDTIETDVTDSVFIIDNNLDYFQSHFNEPSKFNFIIVINEIVNDFEDYPIEAYISKNRILTSLSAVLFDLKNTSNNFDKKYFSVEMKNMSLNEKCPCELYLKISEEKYLKVLNKDDLYDQEFFDRYIKKSEHLYVLKEHFYLFGSFLYGQDDLERKISQPFSAGNVDHLKLVHDMAKSYGISESVMTNVSNSMEDIKGKSEGQIKKLFTDFEKLGGSFLYSHSYFTSLLCVEIGKKLNWFKPQHLDKLVMASIVHDMGYLDENNCLNESLPKSKLEELPIDVRTDIFSHIDRVLEILESHKEIDSDVINIIKRHHGARGEESYPKVSYAKELDLLSGLFLLTHTFVVSLFKMSFNTKKIDKILAYIEMVYNKGNLKKLYPDFKTEILKLFNS